MHSYWSCNVNKFWGKTVYGGAEKAEKNSFAKGENKNTGVEMTQSTQ